MDSLLDYILWMGDYPISATGFLDADALVLCALSYIDLSGVFSVSETPAVRDCLDMLAQAEPQVHITGSTDGYRELLALAAASTRFGVLRMSGYVDVLHPEPPLQFSAVCFHDADFTFLAYRGTDNSLVGWKEDFMISFTCTESQEQALDYARAHISPGRKCYIGGHSKGGNLALYTACMLDDDLLDALERVYLLDGPGLCPEVMDPSLTARIDGKTRRIIPRFCVIGKLFEPKMTDTRIVRSSGFGVLQHNLITWGIDHGRLALAKDSDPVCLWLNERINGWVETIPQEERSAFIDELFDALSAGGAQTVNDLKLFGSDGILSIVKRLRETSTPTKRALSELTEIPKLAVKSGIDHLIQKYTAKPAEEPADALPESVQP